MEKQTEDFSFGFIQIRYMSDISIMQHIDKSFSQQIGLSTDLKHQHHSMAKYTIR